MCGVDHPAFAEHLAAPRGTTRQAYHSPQTYAAVRRLLGEVDPSSDLARRLNDAQEYHAGPFIPLSTLHAAGQDGPLRIGIVWESIDKGAKEFTGGNDYLRMCNRTGNVITITNAAGGTVVNGYTCADADVVFPGNARYAQMVARTEGAVSYWGSTLRVRPVLDPIYINNATRGRYHLDATLEVSNVDVVMVMTAEPSPDVAIAGYAGCQQQDQYGRCTVGVFNWVPALLNLATPDAGDTITSELHTAIHEMVHVLGGMGPGPAGNTVFIDELGAPRPLPPAPGSVYLTTTDNAYPGLNKQVTYITSPRVVNVTRTQLACDAMPGFPLEDLPLGAGSHWEARLAGGELMSYGTYSTIVYVSDLTLAFLEDTNQYIANYSNAGKIPTGIPDANDFSVSSLSFLQSQGTDSASAYTPPPPPSPGHLLWGSGVGCALWNGTPSTAWPPLNQGLTCTQNQQYGCTQDNRMSAVCVINPNFVAEGSCGSEGAIDPSTGAAYGGCGGGGIPNPGLVGGGNGVPPMFRFFATDAAAAAAAGAPGALAQSTGGELSAMDYVPVYMGYWACQDSNPISNASSSSESGSFSLDSFASVFGQPSDMNLFGGQARCTDCRCFSSSLMELTRGITPTFPIYGLCYRFNCYRSDYLQIAVRGNLGSNTLYWYGCPVGGGKVR